jgi:hypothetical protein
MTRLALLTLPFLASFGTGAAAAAFLGNHAKQSFAEVEEQMVSDAGLAASALRSPELYDIVSEYAELKSARPDGGLRLAILAAVLAQRTGDETRRAVLVATAQRWCEKTGHVVDCTPEGISTTVTNLAKTSD